MQRSAVHCRILCACARTPVRVHIRRTPLVRIFLFEILVNTLLLFLHWPLSTDPRLAASSSLRSIASRPIHAHWIDRFVHVGRGCTRSPSMDACTPADPDQHTCTPRDPYTRTTRQTHQYTQTPRPVHLHPHTYTRTPTPVYPYT